MIELSLQKFNSEKLGEWIIKEYEDITDKNVIFDVGYDVKGAEVALKIREHLKENP